MPRQPGREKGVRLFQKLIAGLPPKERGRQGHAPGPPNSGAMLTGIVVKLLLS